jgi:hypothetical protein
MAAHRNHNFARIIAYLLFSYFKTECPSLDPFTPIATILKPFSIPISNSHKAPIMPGQKPRPGRICIVLITAILIGYLAATLCASGQNQIGTQKGLSAAVKAAEPLSPLYNIENFRTQIKEKMILAGDIGGTKSTLALLGAAHAGLQEIG